MANPDPEALAELAAAVNETARPVYEDFLRAAKDLHDAIGGPEGLAELVAARDRWQREHPGMRFGQSCHCFCQRWGHLGVCERYAETFLVMSLNGEPVHVPVCAPCARLTETAQAEG